MTAIDPFFLGQIASALTAVMALSGVILLKSSRLRNWCALKMTSLLRDILDEPQYVEHRVSDTCDEIADLQERVVRLEAICDDLMTELDRHQLQR